MALEITRPQEQKVSITVGSPVNRWDQAVIDLIIMTNQRRVTWKTAPSPAPHYDVVYNTGMDTKIGRVLFALSVVRTSVDIRDQLLMSTALPAGINRTPLLIMTKENGEEVVFPDLDSINSLALAVQREAQLQDADELLDEIHKIAVGDSAIGSDKMSVIKHDEHGNLYE